MDGTADQGRSRFRTLPDALAAAPASQPFATMWRSDDDIERVTFGEFRREAAALAAWFESEGLRTGDTVVLVMPQGIPLMAAFVGAMILGGVPAILAYPNFKVEPAKYRAGLRGVTENLKAAFVVLDADFPSELREYVARDGGVRLLHCGERPDSAAGASIAWGLDGEHLAFIQHSAGTTGLQKGVALSHAAVLRQLDELAAAMHITPLDRIYSWLPLYHDMGLIACFMLPLACHVEVIMQSPADWVRQPEAMVRLISEYRCTLAWVPNFTLQFLARRVRRRDQPEYDLSSMRALINCSEPIRAHSMDEFLEIYGRWGFKCSALQTSYAMAENVFAVTQSRIDGVARPRRLWVDGRRLRADGVAVPVVEGEEGAVCIVSSGRCLPANRVRVVAPAGEEMAEGTVGEILIQSDSLFDGYHNRPDLTANVLKEGWYWSGDLGLTLDGELYVIGRKKDLIIVAGTNVYPEDVEEVVSGHPAIHDGRAVAFGLYRAELGTEEVAVVAEVECEESMEQAAHIEQEVREAVLTELGVVARFVYLKGPRWIVKSTAGKPARAATRAKLLAEHPELLQGQPEELVG